MIAATLIEANQNSNSPEERTEARLVSVSRTITTRLVTQIGMSNQRWRTSAPATASMARTIAQNHQYSQPAVKPAQLPSAIRA